MYRWYITHAIPDDVISQLQARTTEHNNAKILKLHQMNLYLILKWDSSMCGSREREVVLDVIYKNNIYRQGLFLIYE